MIYLKKIQAAFPSKPPAVINDFSSSGTTLYWNVTGADTVSIDYGIGTVNSSGSVDTGRVFWPWGGTRTYTLTANVDGQVTLAYVSITYAGCVWARLGWPQFCE